jgi:hypothetical protein
MLFEKIKNLFSGLLKNNSKPLSPTNLYMIQQEKKEFLRLIEEALANKRTTDNIYYISQLNSKCVKYPVYNYNGSWENSHQQFIARKIAASPKWLKVFCLKRLEILEKEFLQQDEALLNKRFLALGGKITEKSPETPPSSHPDMFPIISQNSTGGDELYWSAVSGNWEFWADVLKEENMLLRLATVKSAADTLMRFSDTL